MRQQKRQLFVRAVANANVHEMSPEGEFITRDGQVRRVVGKTYDHTIGEWVIDPAGVLVHYHSEYIRHLKEQSLLPVNLETAQAAGVTWVVLDKGKNQ